MHVHWLLPAEGLSRPAVEASHLASVRLRAAVAIARLDALGMTATAGDTIDPRADRLVVGKIGADCGDGRADRWLQAMRDSRGLGRPVLLDYTDHHLALDAGAMPAFYRAALPLADRVVVPSPHLQSLLAARHPATASLIEDAVEVPVIPPKAGRRSQAPTLLWFGHSSNLAFLVDLLERRCTPADRFELLVLSNRAGLERLAQQPLRSPATLRIRAAEWSPRGMLEAATLADGCLIPADPGHPLKSGASANRLVTALALGLPTAADPLASYQPHARAFFDLSRGPVHHFVEQLDHFAAQARWAQEFVVPGYAPDLLGQRWVDLLKGLGTTR